MRQKKYFRNRKEIMGHLKISSEVKKDVGTLSNSLSGVQRRNDRTSLQIERSGSVETDNHLPADILYLDIPDNSQLLIEFKQKHPNYHAFLSRYAHQVNTDYAKMQRT